MRSGYHDVGQGKMMNTGDSFTNEPLAVVWRGLSTNQKVNGAVSSREAFDPCCDKTSRSVLALTDIIAGKLGGFLEYDHSNAYVWEGVYPTPHLEP